MRLSALFLINVLPEQSLWVLAKSAEDQKTILLTGVEPHLAMTTSCSGIGVMPRTYHAKPTEYDKATDNKNLNLVTTGY